MVLLIGISIAWAQAPTEQIIPVKAGQKVEMDFKYPELISISTWDKSEIRIVSKVSINNGANDDAFELTYDAGESLRIRSGIRDYDNLPRNIVIRHGGEDYFFNTDDHHDPAIQKFKQEKDAGGIEYMQHGVIVDITLEITVPKDIVLEVDAKFGLVEVVGFTRNMEIESKFGGIDVSFDPSLSATLDVRTKFGEVYSNLDTQFRASGDYQIGRWTTLEGKVNSARNTQSMKSEFGNVYLRKR